MICAAPASTPPCTQLSPMPPTPNTAIEDPASTRARFSTAPTPVMIPQPMSAARSKGTRGSTGMALCSRTSVSSANAEALANWYAGAPRSENGVTSFGLGALRHAGGLPPPARGPDESRPPGPQHDGHRVRDRAVDDALIRVTEAGGANRDPDLAGAGIAHGDVLDDDAPGRAMEKDRPPAGFPMRSTRPAC